MQWILVNEIPAGNRFHKTVQIRVQEEKKKKRLHGVDLDKSVMW